MFSYVLVELFISKVLNGVDLSVAFRDPVSGCDIGILYHARYVSNASRRRPIAILRKSG